MLGIILRLLHPAMPFVTEHLWDLIDAAQAGATDAKLLRPGDRPPEPLLFEQVNAPSVMSPWEVRCHLAFIAEQIEPHPELEPELEAVMKRLDRFADGWAALWARFGPSDAGLAEYRQLAARARADVEALGGKNVRLRNELDVSFVLDQLIFIMAVADQPAATIPARLAS